MAKIILVRHGETVWNKIRRIHGGSTDIPLSEKGLIQAECLAQRLDKEKIKAVFNIAIPRWQDSLEEYLTEIKEK